MKTRALLAVLALTASAPAQKWFDAPLVLVHSGQADEIRAIGDVDQDGDPDVLSFYGATSSGIWISFTPLLNDGTGRFAPAGTTALPSGQNVAILRPLLGDVTGDGDPDLVLSTNNSPTIRGVRVFPGAAGATFGASVFFALPGNPMDIALRDRDGNGVLDVAVLHFNAASQSAVRWLTWNGAGFASSAEAAVPDFANSIEAMDATGDGVPDLLAGEWFGTNVWVMPTVAGNPTPGFALPVPGPVGGGRLLSAGDLEGDGDTDVLVTTDDYNSGLRFVALENDGTGSLTVGAEQFFSGQFVPYLSSYGIDLGDWDGDGDLDVLNHSENLTLFANDGANAFAFAAVTPTDFDAIAPGPADFDGDGNLDFCAPRVLAFGNGTFHSAVQRPIPSDAPTAAVPRDWEGDGDVDFLDTQGQALVNDGTGSFALTASLWPAPPPGHIYKDPVAVADFDGDGRNDYLLGFFVLVPLPPPGMFIAVFEEMRLFVDDGVGGYADAGAAAPPGLQIGPQLLGQMTRPVVDLDGDGDLDVLVGGFVWLNDGTGFFAAPVSLFPGNAVDAADVDADGDVDVLVTESVGSNPLSLVLRRNLGGLTFSAQTLSTSINQDTRGHFVDLEGDGDLDVAVGSGPNGLELRLVENAGGNFGAPVILPTSPFVTQLIAADDVDGDGLIDVVTGPFDVNPNGSWVNVFRRVGPGLVYEPRVEYLARIVRAFPDLDGDGDLDVSGLAMVRGWRFDGPDAGSIRQYGPAVAGTGGVLPVLGASGPMRPGSTTATLRLRRALGGSAALLAIGTAEGFFPNPPVPGMTALVGGAVSFFALPVFGAPGVAGAGFSDLPIPIPVLGTLVSTSVFLQAGIFDPGAPFLLTATNGLELHVGA